MYKGGVYKVMPLQSNYFESQLTDKKAKKSLNKISTMKRTKNNVKVTTEITPNPGSPYAVDLGCKCPVLDNNHGEGNGPFWRTEGCPIHLYICTESEYEKEVTGRKDDTGKLRYDLIPVGPLSEVAKVYSIGSVKYGD